MLLNLYLYSKLQTEISLVIFVIVNTTGVILFIILDYECCIQNEVLNDGILARGIGKKKSQPPAAGLQSVFQLLGGLGLIINTITIVDSWLGPIV